MTSSCKAIADDSHGFVKAGKLDVESLGVQAEM